RRSGGIKPVVRGDVQVHGAQPVLRTDEVELLRDEQIAEVDGAELTETDQAADRLPVFIASPRCRTLGRAPAGGLAGSGERGRKHAAPGTHDLPLEAGNL